MKLSGSTQSPGDTLTTAEAALISGVTAGTFAKGKVLTQGSTGSGYIDKVSAVEFQLMDTDASNTLSLFWNEDESSADRTLNLKVNGASPTLDLLGGTNTFNGTMGIGTSSLEAWDSAWTALQIGGNCSLMHTTAKGAGSQSYYLNNAYYDGSWKYISTDEASQYLQSGGSHLFRIASSGTADTAISWTTALTIDNNATATFEGDIIVPQGNKIHLDNGQEYFESNGTNILVYVAGSIIYTLGQNVFNVNYPNGPALRRESSSATNPTVIPDYAGNGYGLGGQHPEVMYHSFQTVLKDYG